jgi:hypothetical protein
MVADSQPVGMKFQQGARLRAAVLAGRPGFTGFPDGGSALLGFTQLTFGLRPVIVYKEKPEKSGVFSGLK